jgi:GMP synthase-like glutamine amidotransferase
MLERLLDLGPLARFDVQRRQWPGAPEDYDAYLITGSPAGVYDPLPWIGELKAFLQAAKGKTALVGICFGHQVMAEAFGGKVVRSPKGWGVGLHDYRVTKAQSWTEGAPGFSIPASHQDQVVVRPPQAEVMASSAFTPFAGLAYRDQRAISFQGHPEFEADYAKALLSLRRGSRLPQDQADAAIASLGRPNDCARVGGWIRAFLETAARPTAAH